MPTPDFFPPPVRGLKGRRAELATLFATVLSAAPARLALVGSGGSGKSMLAAALGHRLARRFEGRIHWFRVGAWDYYTLLEILARYRLHKQLRLPPMEKPFSGKDVKDISPSSLSSRFKKRCRTLAVPGTISPSAEIHSAHVGSQSGPRSRAMTMRMGCIPL